MYYVDHDFANQAIDDSLSWQPCSQHRDVSGFSAMLTGILTLHQANVMPSYQRLAAQLSYCTRGTSTQTRCLTKPPTLHHGVQQGLRLLRRLRNRLPPFCLFKESTFSLRRSEVCFGKSRNIRTDWLHGKETRMLKELDASQCPTPSTLAQEFLQTSAGRVHFALATPVGNVGHVSTY